MYLAADLKELMDVVLHLLIKVLCKHNLAHFCISILLTSCKSLGIISLLAHFSTCRVLFTLLLRRSL